MAKGINTQVIQKGGGAGSSTFIGLTDVPATYVGQALKGTRVNAGETALEFFTLGGGTGTVTSVGSADGSVTVTNPTTTPDLAIIKSPKLTTARTISTTGDVAYTSGTFDGTANVTGTATLATVNSNVGTFGSATQVPQYTVNGKGLTTASANVSIQIAESQVTNLTTDLSAKEATANKDASGGYVGLTLFKINFKNVANTFTSFFTNSNTASRTYTFQDRDGTIADNTDLALKAPLASPTFTGTVTLPAGQVVNGVTLSTAQGTGNFLRGDGTYAAPAGGGDMVLASTQTNSGLKTFLDATLGLRNVANTFTSFFTNTATASRTYTLKDASGTLAFTSDITGTNSGTNTGDVTLAGTPNYITIAGQVITRALIDLTTHVTGLLPFANIANVATSTVMYRKTASTGPIEAQTLATLKTDLGLTGTNSGDQTSIVGITGTLAQFNTAITDADITPTTRLISTTAPLSGGGDLSADRTLTTSMTTNKLIGRGTAGTGVMEEITLGTNLSLSGTTLNATGGSGSGITRSVSSISTNTSAGSTAVVDYVYICTATLTLTLPTAVGNTNRYSVKNTGGTTTIATTASQTIDGSTSAVISVQYVSIELISDGSNWNII